MDIVVPVRFPSRSKVSFFVLTADVAGRSVVGPVPNTEKTRLVLRQVKVIFGLIRFMFAVIVGVVQCNMKRIRAKSLTAEVGEGSPIDGRTLKILGAH